MCHYQRSRQLLCAAAQISGLRIQVQLRHTHDKCSLGSKLGSIEVLQKAAKFAGYGWKLLVHAGGHKH